MKLADYLNQKRGRAAELAAQLDVAHSTVMRWARGEHMPTLRDCAALERLTGGTVTAEDFLRDVRAS